MAAVGSIVCGILRDVNAQRDGHADRGAPTDATAALRSRVRRRAVRRFAD